MQAPGCWRIHCKRTSWMRPGSPRESYCCCSHRVLCCATGNELMIGVVTKDGFVSSRDIHEWASTHCKYSHILMLFAGKDSIVGLQVVSKGRNKRRSSVLSLANRKYLKAAVYDLMCFVLPFTMHRLIVKLHFGTYASRKETGTSALMSNNGFPIPKMVPSLEYQSSTPSRLKRSEDLQHER